MKKIILICFYLTFCLMTSQLRGQLTGQSRNSQMEEPYPAPISYENISREKARFIALFESRNIGNLHLWVKRKFKYNRAFKGTRIPKKYKYFFPSNIWRNFKKRKLRPRALYSIKGDGEEWYIMRISDKKGKNTLRLYEFQKNSLIEKMILADTFCADKICQQMDSWIRDLDGDTQLDIVQKIVLMDANGKTLQSDLTIYALNKRGFFVENKNIPIDKSDYKLTAIIR